MPPADDERLIELYDAHAAPVWRYVVHLTGDRAGADDVVQETLLRAWRTPRILEEPATARAWRTPTCSLAASARISGSSPMSARS